MANEYAVNQADLQAVADAIRTKGGTSDELTFPDGFVDAVGAIQAGGGDDDDIAVKILDGTIKTYTSDTLTSIKSSRFLLSELEEISCPNVTTIGDTAFSNSQLKRVSFPSVKTIENYTFRSCVKLTDVGSLHETVTAWKGGCFQGCSALIRGDFVGAKTVTGGMLENCTALESIWLPNVEGSLPQFAYNTTNCKKIDLGKPETTTFSFPRQTFRYTTGLEVLILRFGCVVSAGATNLFENSKLLNGGKVYVPAAYVEVYKTATNWSTWFNAGNFTFEAIEGSEYE